MRAGIEENFRMESKLKKCVQVGKWEFTFSLCRKTELSLGDVTIEQWWMNQRGLYGIRKKKCDNYTAILDFYWACCLLHKTCDQKEVLESYLLAQLLPQTRSNGSRKIFNDSKLPRETLKKRLEQCDQLESLLVTEPNQLLTRNDFYLKVAGILGAPAIQSEIFECYEEFRAELLDEACSELQQDRRKGITLAKNAWKTWNNKYSRRSDRTGANGTPKQIMDIFSYEARTALHRCYSNLWMHLINKFVAEDSWNEPTKNFHGLWHLDIPLERTSNTVRNTHLFQGHVFGLHPSGSLLLSTNTGKNLVGELICAPDDEECQNRFLNAMLKAIYVYLGHGETIRSNRIKKPHLFDDFQSKTNIIDRIASADAREISVNQALNELAVVRQLNCEVCSDPPTLEYVQLNPQEVGDDNVVVNYQCPICNTSSDHWIQRSEIRQLLQDRGNL